MRVLIVDDEAPARERLRRLLVGFADIEVIGEARDGEETLRCVDLLGPDALFLDVQMPGPSGFDVAASLVDPAPAVVFVTAYDRYALQAFDTAAIDYLLKPIDPDRLARAIDRLRARTRLQSLSEAARDAHSTPGHLLIADGGRTHVLPVLDIYWLEAADNYVVVHAAEQAPLMRRTLSGLLDDLGAAFVRCHRGFAVAITQVVRMDSRGRGDSMLILRDGQVVPCSRQYRAAVIAALARHQVG